MNGDRIATPFGTGAPILGLQTTEAVPLGCPAVEGIGAVREIVLVAS